MAQEQRVEREQPGETDIIFFTAVVHNMLPRKSTVTETTA